MIKLHGMKNINISERSYGMLKTILKVSDSHMQTVTDIVYIKKRILPVGNIIQLLMYLTIEFYYFIILLF
jgi:hypothetical protein